MKSEPSQKPQAGAGNEPPRLTESVARYGGSEVAESVAGSLEIKECLRCGYRGPRLRSYSTSLIDRNLFVRTLAVPLLLVPGARRHFFYTFFDGVSRCPHCGEMKNHVAWAGPVSETEMGLWRVLQEKEDQIRADRNRKFRMLAVVGLSMAAVAIILFRRAVFE